MLADPGVDLSKQEGCRVHVERVVHGLRSAGHEVDFIAVQPGERVLVDMGYGLQHFFEAIPLEPKTTPEASLRASSLSAEVLRVTKEICSPIRELATSDLAFCAGRRLFRRSEVIHARLSTFDVGSALCAHDLGIPLVVEVNTPPLLEAKEFYPQIFDDESERLARFAATKTLGAARAIVTVSSPLRDMLVSSWEVPPSKITILPNAADAPPPTPSARVMELRAQHGLGSGPVVVFVGALQPWHGVEALLEAFGQVRAEHPETTLLLVGDGPMRKLLEERVEKLTLRDAVRFAGAVHHERVAELLTLADVAVAPYPRLPFEFYFSPIKLFEYMAAGKAIVASRVGQLSEIFIDGETALLVDAGSNDELAQAIGRLLRDPGLRERLGNCAREKAAREHTWVGYVHRLTAIYESVLMSDQTSADVP